MVIKLDNDFEQCLLSCKTLPPDEFNFLNHILELMKDHKVFFSASKDFFLYLVANENNRFSENVRGLLKKLVDNYTTIFSDAMKITPLFIVTKDKTSYTIGDESIIIPFSELPYDLTPYLCCENSDDSIFYYTVFKNLGSFVNSVVILPDSYGGGTAKSCVGTWIDNKKVFIAIADSDKKFPGDNIGNTAQAIIDVFAEKNPLSSMYYIIKVHEKENLFPFDLMKPSNKTVKAIINYIKTLQSKDDYQNYFDIKSGIKKSDADGTGDNCKKNGWISFNQPIIDFVINNNLVTSQQNCKHLFPGVTDKEISRRLTKGIDFGKFSSLLNNVQKKDFEIINSNILKFGYVYKGIAN